MKTTEDLMREIAQFDCEPMVYNVSVYASSHRAGFSVSVSFRTYDPNQVREISTSGETPETALENALNQLKTRFAEKCPHCEVALHIREGNKVS